MAEFCACGSIIINDHCTNKNCTNKPANSTASVKATKTKKETKASKSTKTRKASKCITYNLYDIKEEENVN